MDKFLHRTYMRKCYRSIVYNSKTLDTIQMSTNRIKKLEYVNSIGYYKGAEINEV